MSIMNTKVWLLLSLTAISSPALSHGGGTNSQGCHAGSQPYHCHGSSPSPTTTSDRHEARFFAVGDLAGGEITVYGRLINSSIDLSLNNVCSDGVLASWLQSSLGDMVYFEDQSGQLCVVPLNTDVCVMSSATNRNYGYFVNFTTQVQNGFYSTSDLDRATIEDICIFDQRTNETHRLVYKQEVGECRVDAPTITTPIALPSSSVCIDTDGDGWGWDGNASCIP